jgi:hypothetical protein
VANVVNVLASTEILFREHAAAVDVDEDAVGLDRRRRATRRRRSHDLRFGCLERRQFLGRKFVEKVDFFFFSGDRCYDF